MQRFLSVYFIGYLLFLGGVMAALWKSGILERVGPAWSAIGVVIAIGIGLMLTVSGTAADRTTVVDVDRRR